MSEARQQVLTLGRGQTASRGAVVMPTLAAGPIEWLYRTGLLLLPLLSGMGSAVSIAGVAPVRPFALVFAAVAAIRLMRSPAQTLLGWMVVAGALGWVGWGFLYPGADDAVSELASIGLGMATVWALVARPASRTDVNYFAAGWAGAWVISVVPAFWEILTGDHLPNYLEGSSDYVRSASTDIASFFMNPNLFAYFLAVAMVMLAAGAAFTPSLPVRRVYWSFAAATPVIIAFTGSRLTLAVSLGILVWLVWAWHPGRVRRLLAAGAVAFLTLAAVLLLLAPQLVEQIGQEFAGSGVERINLYRNGIWMLQESAGFGVGPGRFEELMVVDTPPFDTGGALNPHSGVFEVASQYGIGVSAAAFGVLAAVAWFGLRGFVGSFRDQNESIVRQSILVSALSLPVLSFANSTFLDSPIAWAHIASIAMLVVAVRFTPASVLFGPVEKGRADLRRRYRLRESQRALVADAS